MLVVNRTCNNNDYVLLIMNKLIEYNEEYNIKNITT